MEGVVLTSWNIKARVVVGNGREEQPKVFAVLGPIGSVRDNQADGGGLPNGYQGAGVGWVDASRPQLFRGGCGWDWVLLGLDQVCELQSQAQPKECQGRNLFKRREAHGAKKEARMVKYTKESTNK